MRLNNPRQIRRFLGRILNEIYEGTMSEQRGKALAYVSQVLLRAIETDDIENRLSALESKLDAKDSECPLSAGDRPA